jgi:mRNA-degrading endonuclease YafQ of YafQ-DinJ toxin-antitoxin module
MEVAFSEPFKKALKKKFRNNPDFENQFWLSLQLFIENPFHAQLKTHKLSGRLRNLWSFSISYHYRVVFYFTIDKPKKAVLIDIGTHEEVY